MGDAAAPKLRPLPNGDAAGPAVAAGCEPRPKAPNALAAMAGSVEPTLDACPKLAKPVVQS